MLFQTLTLHFKTQVGEFYDGEFYGALGDRRRPRLREAEPLGKRKGL